MFSLKEQTEYMNALYIETYNKMVRFVFNDDDELIARVVGYTYHDIDDEDIPAIIVEIDNGEWTSITRSDIKGYNVI